MIEIREAKLADTRAILNFLIIAAYENNQKRTLAGEYPQELELLKEEIDKTFEASNDFILISLENKQVTGMIDFYDETEEDEPPIAEMGITVLKKFRGCGIGKALMREAIALAKKNTSIKKILLSLDAENKIALELYRQFGFRITQTFSSKTKSGYEMILDI